jgi:hypothetical protein
MEDYKGLITKGLVDFGFEFEDQTDQIIINNFFIFEDNTRATLSLLYNSPFIKDIKGKLCPVKSVEDIVFFHYYQYYLKQLSEFPDSVLTKFWKEKYDTFGLLDKKKETRDKRMKAFIKEIEEHCQLQCGIKNNRFWQDVAEEFPEFVYYGPAYRGVITSKEGLSEDELKVPGYSWALTMDGVKNFILFGDSYDETDCKGFHVVKAMIKGISLIHIFKELKESHPEIKNSFIMEEEEIISLEVISISDYKWVSSSEDIYKLL